MSKCVSTQAASELYQSQDAGFDGEGRHVDSRLAADAVAFDNAAPDGDEEVSMRVSWSGDAVSTVTWELVE